MPKASEIEIESVQIYAIDAGLAAKALKDRWHRKTKNLCLTLTGRTLRASIENVNNPNHDVCVGFIIQKGSKALTGRPAGRRYIHYNDTFWSRRTPGEITGTALPAHTNGKPNLHLIEEPALNAQPVKQQLLDLIATHLP